MTPAIVFYCAVSFFAGYISGQLSDILKELRKLNQKETTNGTQN